MVWYLAPPSHGFGARDSISGRGVILENQTEQIHVLVQQGTRLLAAGRSAEATTILERAYALNRDHFDAALNLSAGYILTRRFGQAASILEALAERDPENPMVWTNLGAAYLGNPILATDDKQRQAVRAFRRALEINPLAPNVAYNLGLIYRDRHEQDEAVRWFHRALQANPNDQDARYWIRKLHNDAQ